MQTCTAAIVAAATAAGMGGLTSRLGALSVQRLQHVLQRQSGSWLGANQHNANTPNSCITSILASCGSGGSGGASWTQCLGSVLALASSRGFASSSAAAAGDSSATAEPARRRRRGATESQAVLRRTTESRAAIEDVAVMTRSQLIRRNKPWLAEQCWQQGLSHDGLKDELIQRLLAWQTTDAGKEAAAAAVSAAAAARAAINAAAAAAAEAPAAATAANSVGVATGTPAAAAPAPAAAAAATSAEAAGPPSVNSTQLARPAGGACAVAVALPAEEHDAAEENAAARSAAGRSPAVQATTEGQGVGAVGWQAPRSAAAAAGGSVSLFLGQLREQPGNAAIVAAARNAVEQYTQQLLTHGDALSSSSASSRGSAAGQHPPAALPATAASTDSAQQLVMQLAAMVSQHSTPQSLAALAKACYSREVQNPVLAASMAEAVAAVAVQLGPQEVYGVLRLLVEHLGSAEEDPVGFRTMDKGFRVLAGAMIRCSEALKPVQLAEAVQLLGVHQYDDAFGLWMISKEAAARLTEFDPDREGSSVVILLDAIAGMHVADDAMTSDVAAAVLARKGEYSNSQLVAIDSALQRMGCSIDLL